MTGKYHSSENKEYLFSSISKHSRLDIGDWNRDELYNFLHRMLLIRQVEIKLAENRKAGLIGGPVHLGVGQEAVATGIAKCLTESDRVFGAHRSHSHVISLGADIRRLFAEVLGKETGLSKGMGGSMHLWDQNNGFFGSVPIVAGTVSLAVGAGMAARLKQTNDIAVAYFGDGACEEGVVHESLNLAKLNSEPVLFVVENNLYASHMHWTQRQPFASTARFAQANGIASRVVDGNNVLEVANAAEHLISDIRVGRGPGFIEAVTYRWYGHVDWREDVDVGLSRSREEISNWKAKDPVRRLSTAMIEAGLLTDAELQDLNMSIRDLVERSWDQAVDDPYPELDVVRAHVYGK